MNGESQTIEFKESWKERNIYVPHPSYPRNKHLADAFYLMGFTETWGRGLHKICTLIECAKQAHPLVEPTPEGLRVTFFRPRVEKGGDENVVKTVVKGVVDMPGEVTEKTTEKKAELMMRLIRDNSQITIGELANQMNISDEGVFYHIKKLKAAGRLRRIGPDKGGHWEVVS